VSEAALAVAPNELVLGRYRPLQPLGSGGNGSVWLARDEPTGVEIALKIVPREGKSASRAEREASAAARLRHPGCQRAYALARDSRHVYIAYEYVPGRTLRQALREGAVDDADALEVAAQVCEVLAHAHAHRIVHRDVKPSNILLAESDEISIRLLDFGLARATSPEHSLTSPLSGSGVRSRVRPPTSGQSASCSGKHSPVGTRSGRGRSSTPLGGSSPALSRWPRPGRTCHGL
jgi:serine/threonine protein kinase